MTVRGAAAISIRPVRIVALYVRVSTDSQKDNWSVKDQLALDQHPAVLRLGLRVVVYDDQGISAERIVNRPAMRRLLDDIEAGKVAAVVATDWNRLSRDEYMEDGLAIIRSLRENDVLFITPEKSYDPNSDNDCFAAQIELLLASAQKKKNVRAMARGQYRKHKDGGVAGGTAAYGYQWEFSEPHADGRMRAKLVVDPDEAPIVRRIFSLYVEGLPLPNGSRRLMTLKGIAVLLNKEGLTVRCRKSIKRRDGTVLFRKGDRRPFEEQDIRRWLELRCYVGLLPWSEGELVVPAGGGEPVAVRSRHVRDLPELEVFHADKQIIDTGLWNRAQALRRERAMAPRRTACTEYALAGLLRCPLCQGPMGSALQTRPNANKPDGIQRHHAYSCLDHKRFGAARCKGTTISERAARAAVEILLLEEIATLDLREWLDAAAEERRRKVEGRWADEYRDGLRRVQVGLDNLVREVANGNLSGDDVRAQRLELMEHRDDLKQRLAALAVGQDDRDATRQHVVNVATDPESYLRGLGGAEFRRLARALLASVIVEGEGAGPARRARVVDHRLSRAYALATGRLAEADGAVPGTFEWQPSGSHSEVQPSAGVRLLLGALPAA
jgi:DNA invertase Pin-like site-specific DNA recombinase